MPPGGRARGRDVTVYDRARIPAHPHGHCRGCGHPLLPRTRCYGAIPCTLHITGSAVSDALQQLQDGPSNVLHLRVGRFSVARDGS